MATAMAPTTHEGNRRSGDVTSIGKDIPHESARGHVSGEAIFIDDMPPARGELLVDFIGAPVAHGKLISVDVSAARTAPGIATLG